MLAHIEVREVDGMYLHSNLASGMVGGRRFELGYTMGAAVLVRIGEQQCLLDGADIVQAVYDALVAAKEGSDGPPR